METFLFTLGHFQPFGIKKLYDILYSSYEIMHRKGVSHHTYLFENESYLPAFSLERKR